MFSFYILTDFSRNYDTTLYRLAAHQEDSWRGVAPSTQGNLYNPEPPVLAAKFAKKPGNQHILAIANEDGKVSLMVVLKCFRDPNEDFLYKIGRHTECLYSK